jgi:Zn-dependent oligopeptidase
MQRELEMDLNMRITESQYEALKTEAETSGDSLEEWLHTTVMQGIKDIEIYFRSENLREKLYKKLDRDTS